MWGNLHFQYHMFLSILYKWFVVITIGHYSFYWYWWHYWTSLLNETLNFLFIIAVNYILGLTLAKIHVAIQELCPLTLESTEYDIGLNTKILCLFKLFKNLIVGLGFLVFNTTFNNILFISWLSVLLVEESGVPRENHQPAASYLSHTCIEYTSPEQGLNSQR
jgi:hypothetical protein